MAFVFTKTKFSFLFVFLFFLALFFPISTQAVICTYQAQNPNDLPMCHPVGSDADCNAFCAQLGRPCGADSINRTCEDFLIGQRANQQRRAEEQEFQRQQRALIPPAERLIEQESILLRNAGECLCSVGNEDAPLTALGGLSIDGCYDRDDTGNGSLYNCRWVETPLIEPTLNENINELDALGAKILREQNPLQNYKSSVFELNKLRATSVEGFIASIIKTATGIMGTIALTLMIYGGFLWLTSQGNGSQIEKARSIIFYGAIGIFVILGSYALVSFVFEAVNPINTSR